MRLLFATIALLSFVVVKPVTPAAQTYPEQFVTSCASGTHADTEADDCYALYVAPDALPAWT